MAVRTMDGKFHFGLRITTRRTADEIELWLARNIDGRSQLKLGGVQFDGAGNAIKHFDILFEDETDLDTFRSDYLGVERVRRFVGRNQSPSARRAVAARGKSGWGLLGSLFG